MKSSDMAREEERRLEKSIKEIQSIPFSGKALTEKAKQWVIDIMDTDSTSATASTEYLCEMSFKAGAKAREEDLRALLEKELGVITYRVCYTKPDGNLFCLFDHRPFEYKNVKSIEPLISLKELLAKLEGEKK